MKPRPGVVFHSAGRLFSIQPRGIWDDFAVASLVQYLEEREDEADEPFNRFTDLSRLDAIDLDLRFVYRVALHRRRFYAERPPVKSAFYVTSQAVARAVQVHAELNAEPPLQVRVFESLDSAALWLEVPRKMLEF